MVIRSRKKNQIVLITSDQKDAEEEPKQYFEPYVQFMEDGMSSIVLKPLDITEDEKHDDLPIPDRIISLVRANRTGIRLDEVKARIRGRNAAIIEAINALVEQNKISRTKEGRVVMLFPPSSPTPSEDAIKAKLEELTLQWGDGEVKLNKLCEALKATHGWSPDSVKNVVYTSPDVFDIDAKGYVTLKGSPFLGVDVGAIVEEPQPTARILALPPAPSVEEPVSQPVEPSDPQPPQKKRGKKSTGPVYSIEDFKARKGAVTIDKPIAEIYSDLQARQRATKKEQE
jgi:hypothetical protein